MAAPILSFNWPRVEVAVDKDPQAVDHVGHQSRHAADVDGRGQKNHIGPQQGRIDQIHAVRRSRKIFPRSDS